MCNFTVLDMIVLATVSIYTWGKLCYISQLSWLNKKPSLALLFQEGLDLARVLGHTLQIPDQN